jgi:hypothetical protein
MTARPPDAERVAVWKREMGEGEAAEFEEAAGYLLDELGYETVSPRESWIPPEEWARAKDRSARGDGNVGLLARLRRGGRK